MNDDLAEPERPTYYLIEDLLQRPELLLPPPIIIPRLAWEGRVTLLAAREKVGKSTLMGQAVASLSYAPRTFLDDDIETPGMTLWLALDEPVGDLVRRLDRLGTTERVAVLPERPESLQLFQIVQELKARLVVIDTLTEFVSGLVDDPNRPAQLQPILKALRAIAQQTGCGIVLLHHASKVNGDYRDSTQIGAGVDAMVLMKEDESDEALRTCKCKGRVPNVDFKMRFVGGRYEVEESDVPIRLQIQRVINGQPGITTRQIIALVKGKTQTVTQELKLIEAAGLIRDAGNDHRSAWITASPNSSNGKHF